MGRKSLKDTRQKEIVEAFYKVAKKEGLENASIGKVAEFMQVNPSLLIHYFKTKDDLLAALIDFNLEKYINIYKISSDKIETTAEILELIENLFSRKWHKLFDDGVYYSCYALTFRNKAFKERFKEMHDSLHHELEAVLIKGNQMNLIKVDNPFDTAKLIFALIDGAYYYQGMVSAKEEYERNIGMYKNYARILLGI